MNIAHVDTKVYRATEIRAPYVPNRGVVARLAQFPGHGIESFAVRQGGEEMSPNGIVASEGLDAYVTGIRPKFEQMLGQFVEIPSISMDPSRRGDIDRAADFAVGALKELGAEVEKVPTPGNPVVFGKLDRDPSYPTITIYNHLDVQPAEGPEWVRQPFVFAVDGDRYNGRGSTDDKGPAITALMGARFAIENNIPVNIRFIWELEEEIGSPNFEHFIASYRDRLSTDCIVVSDTIWIARGKPAIAYGLRGVQGFSITLETGTKDAHSGVTGGVARNPLAELAQLVADCYDVRTGRIKIPGFYKDVLPATSQEIKSFVSSGFSLQGFKKAHEFKKIRKLSAAQALKNIFAMPTFEVHGLVGGYTGPGIKTVIPPRGELKISLRLVPNQSCKKIATLVEKFMKSRNPDIKIVRETSLEPYLGPFGGVYADAGRAAMKAAFGREPAFTREGGSIGAVVTMKNHIRTPAGKKGVPIIFLGLSLPEHGYHAPNEFYDWGQASGGIKMWARYFHSVAEMKGSA